MSKVYDPAYKIEVCKQVESGTATVPEISRETGISENTLYTWMKRYRENETNHLSEAVIYCLEMRK